MSDGFNAPVHIGFGNHDYAVPKVSREMSHELFREKLGLKPYYAVAHRGYKFVHLNNFIGETWNPTGKVYNRGTGSLGEEQLNWFEAHLRERRPTFVFIHYPLVAVKDVEVRDYGILPLLKKYKESIQLVVSGHWHKWFDFARTFGPQHYVMGSTRYDEDAYMLIEVDTKRATHRILNHNCIDWATHYSKPYQQS
ncbi:MAG: metallophosphoesterase [Pyrinomonadaceae bacterium]